MFPISLQSGNSSNQKVKTFIFANREKKNSK